MDLTTESFLKKSEKVFHELYIQILSYLDFTSLMQVLAVSTDFYELSNSYFKHFLITNNLIDHSERQQGADYYLKLFRSFYFREVLAAPLNPQMTSYNELKFTRYPRCSTKGISKFNLGTKFTVFQLYNQDIIFLTTEEYLNPKFDLNSISKKNIRKNVTKFFTESKHLCYLTKTGQVFVIFYDQTKPSHEFGEGVLEYTLTHPVRDCEFSYTKAVLLCDVPKKEQENKPEEEKEGSSKAKKQEIKVWNINELSPETLNDPARIVEAQGLDEEDIRDFCVGNTAAYFTTSKGVTYECDLSATNNNKFMIFPYNYLKSKNIKRLFCGVNYFMALEQEEVKPIDTWTNQEIVAWANTNGFEEYANIIKYENISGKQLMNADKRFLIDVLGVTQYHHPIFL